MLSKDKLPCSTSETIGVAEQRQLIELGRTLNRMLTRNEFMVIATIYNNVIEGKWGG